MKKIKFLYESKEDVNLLSSCFICKHKYKEENGCTAFSVEIPEDILLGKHEHRKKYPEQENDIVFEPIEE